ncbi:hypothetical protein PLESTB_001631400 [Pleodorina starrii]|uniref:Uncharacterized protein n=1 Tax=Pleodorina starrii TaxID=330485 RepID=A0A9W6BZX0_9CHLO|nr:hypothetical protein PLESTM_000974800 [Pleodorina starrii]GLC60591.1 hypothetical protein PLESTB_001631400 [Pleodorina starrii]GLC76675.1 hypothetical protein PLESTF_001815900 [Pleodorina starrii]
MSSTHAIVVGRHAAVQPRLGSFNSHRTRICRYSSVRVRASYDVEVEPPPRAPNSAPRFGGGPPPPPPPPRTIGTLQPPTRRELLFGALGLGVGVASTYAFYNRPIDPAVIDAKLTELLDELLDDEALLDELGQEVGLRQAIVESEEAMGLLEGLKQIEDELDAAIEQEAVTLAASQQPTAPQK